MSLLPEPPSREMASLPLTFVTIPPKAKHTATVIFAHVGAVVIITVIFIFDAP